MAVSPDMARNLAKELLDAYIAAETDMLAVVARRLEAGIDQPGWAEAKLAQTQQVRRRLQAIVRSTREVTARQVEQAVSQAYGIGQASAVSDLEKTGRGRLAASLSPSGDAQAIRALTAELTRTLDGVWPNALRVTEDVYRDVIFDASRGVATGTSTRRRAAQRALNTFANRGITGFVDTAGRRWDLASYTEMAVRSTSGRAAVTGHARKLTDAGLDLVQVSDAPEECSICRPWEGRILSLTGATPNRPTLADAQSAGLFHPNCRHSVGLYDRRITTTPTRTADPEGDEARQRQRYLERQVRQWKRRDVAALSDGERARMQAKVREWQGRLRTHVDTHDRKRLRYREQIGSAR